jgi:hypothetical protein
VSTVVALGGGLVVGGLYQRYCRDFIAQVVSGGGGGISCSSRVSSIRIWWGGCWLECCISDFVAHVVAISSLVSELRRTDGWVLVGLGTLKVGRGTGFGRGTGSASSRGSGGGGALLPAPPSFPPRGSRGLGSSLRQVDGITVEVTKEPECLVRMSLQHLMHQW